MKKVLFIIILSFIITTLKAQKLSFGTNIAQNVNLITLNAEASVSLSRHYSISLSARYNPWRYNINGSIYQNKQRTFSFETRYWPWYVFSGWWLSSGIQYKEYSQMGIFSSYRYEGDKYSVLLGLGYTYMLSSHFNLDIGLKLYSGFDKYRKYDAACCGFTVDRKQGLFVGLDDIIVGIGYVF